VPAVLRWLATHDNPGSRDDLQTALRCILGPAYLALTVSPAGSAPGPRRSSA
jgi:hypothetical protein